MAQILIPSANKTSFFKFKSPNIRLTPKKDAIVRRSAKTHFQVLASISG